MGAGSPIQNVNYEGEHVVNRAAPGVNFRDARERAGLSHDQVAAQSGLPLGAPSIWDIEGCDGDIWNYSPSEIRRFCSVLGIRPAELFGETPDPAIPAQELVSLIRKECILRNLTVEQFEEVVGWRLGACIEPPERLLEDISIDGLQWLCKELRVDWRSAL